MNRLIIVAICMAVVLALTACEQQYAPSEDSDPGMEVQDLTIQNLGVTSTPPVVFCELTFLSPASNASLPDYGPVDFSWHLDPADWITNKLPFDVFLLVITYPGGNPLVHYETQNEHKTLYMENYQPGGTYTAQVRAMSSEDEVLCWDQMTFTKDEFEPQIKEGPGPQLPTPCMAGPCP